MSLFARLFLILASLALVPATVTGVWFLRSNEKAEANARQFHRQMTGVASSFAEQTLAEMNRSLGFAQELDVPVPDPAREFKVLNQAILSYPEFALLSVVGADGKERAMVSGEMTLGKGELADRSAEPEVKAAAASGELAAGPVRLYKGNPAITLVHPLRGKSSLYVVYSLEILAKRCGELKLGASGRTLLLDESLRPLPGFAPGFPEPDWKGPGALAGREGWIDAIETSAGTMVGAYRGVKGLSWTALSLEPKDEAFARPDDFALKAFSFLTLLAILSVGLSYWVTRGLTRPLDSLARAVLRVEQNRFDEPAQAGGWAEVERLNRAFNRMMESLRRFQELQVERQLDEKAKVDALVHTIPSGILLAGFDGEILYINSSARAILSEDGSTHPSGGRTVQRALRLPKLMQLAHEVMSGRKDRGAAEVEMAFAGEKNPRIFACQASTVRRESKPVGILFILDDVTAEKDIERLKDEFFHSIVHDLRGPIASIRGFIDLMQELGEFSDASLKRVEIVRVALHTLQMLVDNILDTVKLQSGIELVIEEARPAELLEHMRKVFSAAAELRQVRLGIEMNAGDGASLRCDAVLIRRVLMNLTGNALKFTPPNGSITLQCSRSGKDEFEFAVQDTGPGIPKDKLQAVFEKFKQLDKGIALRSGYGLGRCPGPRTRTRPCRSWSTAK